MDAIALLKADHKTVEALFREFERLTKKGTPSEKKRVVTQIIKELSVHAAIEEEIFYPAVRAADDDLGHIVLESLEEHHIVKWTLKELSEMRANDERYDAKVTVLIESVRHHVEEEEGELFPDVREAMSRAQLTELATALTAAKKRAPKRPRAVPSAEERFGAGRSSAATPRRPGTTATPRRAGSATAPRRRPASSPRSTSARRSTRSTTTAR